MFRRRQRRHRNPHEDPSTRLARQLRRFKKVQAVILLVNIIAAAFLAGYIGSRDEGLNGGLPAFVILAGISFIFTTFSNWLGSHLGGFSKRGCVGLFLAFDIVCVGTMIGAVAVLSAAHLPWDCKGLTSGNGSRDPKDGYDTTGFGNGDTRGELDRFCHIPRMNWVFALLLLISHIHTLSWSIRLVATLRRRAKEAKADAESHSRDVAVLQPESPPVVVPSLPARGSVLGDEAANVSWGMEGSPPAYVEGDEWDHGGKKK